MPRDEWRTLHAGRIQSVMIGRRDLLDHVIAFSERHLKRLLAEYVRHYHDDRTHLGLQKDTPGRRKTAIHMRDRRVVSMARLGGLHHRYDLTA